jgi:NAD(P)-dependent dehydrogenase (short-subunit alcohol dehydrogenase family)
MTTVSVVTGAGGSMGSACAAALAGTVDVLLLTDVDAARLTTAAGRIESATAATICPVVGNLADPGWPDELAARAAGMGRFRALAHTAGLSPSMADWRQILHVDLAATARLLDAFGRLATAGSVAVCVASVSAHMGAFDAGIDDLLATPLAPDFEERFEALVGAEGWDPDPGATYRLAKRGVIRLCERAAPAWGERGGRVVSVSPGLIDTEMGRLELQHQPIKTWLAEITPIQRHGRDASPLPGRIDDIADAVAFLCSERASFISGCDIRVDGGLVPAMHQG